jgi:hypothetical protein
MRIGRDTDPTATRRVRSRELVPGAIVRHLTVDLADDPGITR